MRRRNTNKKKVRWRNHYGKITVYSGLQSVPYRNDLVGMWECVIVKQDNKTTDRVHTEQEPKIAREKTAEWISVKQIVRR